MYQLLFLGHMLGLIIGAGSAFALVVIAYLAKNFPPQARPKVVISLFPLRYIAYLGLLLLIGTGIGLLIPYAQTVEELPLLVHMKFKLVAILALFSLYGVYLMQQAKHGAAADALPRLVGLGKLSLILLLIILACAVYGFNP